MVLAALREVLIGHFGQDATSRNARHGIAAIITMKV